MEDPQKIADCMTEIKAALEKHGCQMNVTVNFRDSLGHYHVIPQNTFLFSKVELQVTKPEHAESDTGAEREDNSVS